MNSQALTRRSARGTAVTVYALYLLSIPSLAIFAPLGVIVAYATRADADPIARAHLDEQIRLFWIAFAWGAVLFLASIPAWMLTIALIGFPLLWLIGLVGFFVMIWFTIKSGLGLARLLSDARP